MTCDLAPNCYFLFRYFLCTLPEDMIDVSITTQMLKSIHTFRKARGTQTSRCSPWGMEVRPCPSLGKKMQDYIEERQATGNPFSHKSYPFRPNPTPFVKWPKSTPAKKRTVVSKCNINKLSQPRKVNVGYYAPAFKHNWIGQATFPTQSKAAEAAGQTSTVAIPTHQADASFTFTQPAIATVPAMLTNLLVVISDQKSPSYCMTCTILGKLCTTTYLMPLNPNWSNS